jgi:hypothetical protein
MIYISRRRPTQPRISWVLQALSPGKCPGGGADQSPPRLKIRTAIPPALHTSSWWDA